MSTNWMPIAGRGWIPGLSGSAVSIADLVGPAKAPACLRYSGLSYVDARLPAGAQPVPIRHIMAEVVPHREMLRGAAAASRDQGNIAGLDRAARIDNGPHR